MVMLLGVLGYGFLEKGSHMYVAEILLLACVVNNTESGTKYISVDV
jgi:hypothetical protein